MVSFSLKYGVSIVFESDWTLLKIMCNKIFFVSTITKNIYNNLILIASRKSMDVDFLVPIIVYI